MFNFRSLTAKFVFIGCIMLAYIAAYITATYHFTHYMRGEARRINLAGKERMIVVEIAKHLLEINDMPLSLERSYIIEDLKKEINTYEEIILGLRDGSAKHNLSPIHYHANDSINQNNKLIELWQKVQKPEIDGLINRPDKIKLRAFNQKTYSYLEEIDKLVNFIEKHTEEEINNFDTLRNYFFGFLFILTIFLLFYTRKNIVAPVLRLNDATKAIAGGNFEVRAEITTADEIGLLCMTFNNMAQSTGALFKEKTEHLRELETLYRLSSAVSKSISVKEIVNIALDEIMNLEDPGIEKKGLIFLADNKKQVLNLIAYRGFSEEFAKSEAVVPFGDCICGLVAETCKEIISASCFKDERHTRKYPEMKEHGHICIPLKSTDKSIGVFSLYTHPQTNFLNNDIKFYKSFADIIAVSLQNALNHEQVSMLAQSLDSSIDLIAITDMGGSILHVNPQVMSHLGYTPDEILDRDVSIMQSPRNRPGLGQEIYKKSLAGGWQGEVINIKKNGTEYPVFLTTSPVKNESGKVIALIGIARDITKQKTAEDALRKYEHIVSASHDHMSFIDQNCVYQAVNDMYLTAWNRRREEIIGHHVSELLGKELFQKLVGPNIERCLRGETVHYQAWFDLPGLGRRYMDVVYSPFFGKAKTAEGLVVISRDITELQQANETLQKSEDKYRTLIEEMKEGIFIMDDKGVFTFANNALACIHGLEKSDDLIGRKFIEFAPPEDKDKHLQEFRTSIESKQFPNMLEVPIRKPDGSRAYIQLQPQPLIENGCLTGVRGLVRDVTLQKEAEEALRKNNDLLTAISRTESQFIAGMDSRIFFDSLLNELLTLTISEYGFIGEVIHPEDGAPYLKTHAITNIAWNEETRAFFEREAPHGLEFRKLKSLWGTVITTGRPVISNSPATDPRRGGLPDGHPPLNAFLGLPLLAGETMVGMVGVANRPGGYDESVVQYLEPLTRTCGSIIAAHRNTLLRQQAEATIREYAETLEEKVAMRTRDLEETAHDLEEARQTADAANRAKGDFLARMSHEIRTPMNAIIGLSRLALKTELSAQQRDYIAKTNRAALALLGILNDLLDFSKIEAGQLAMETIEFSLDQILDQVINLATAKVESKDIELVIKVAPGTPDILTGDPLRLSQVLTNLVGNAVKFTEAGEIVITIEALEQSATSVTIQFTVQDTGIGLSQEQIDRLFKPFTQADDSITRRYGGSGLGLSICKRLVEMMGGAINVKSEPGRGSVFRFNAVFGLAPDQQARTFQLPDTKLHGLKTLVVDDSPAARESLIMALESFSFRVTAASNGEEAIKAVIAAPADDPYRLVLVDWKMPGLDGTETIWEINRRIKPTEDIYFILLLSAFVREVALRKAADSGICSFLLKPLRASLLFDAIMECFGHGEAVSRSVIEKSALLPEKLDDIQGANILLAEDNELNLQVAMALLKEARCRISVARNGREAVELAIAHDFDLVLMDIQMPEMDGLEATRRIRAAGKGPELLPIIAVTAHAMPEDREKSLAAGMNDHLTKPIDPNALVTTLLRWIPAGDRPTPEYPSPPANLPETEVLLPELPGLAVQAGVSRVAGNRRLYRQLLVEFSRDNVHFVKLVRLALATGDLQEAKQLCHSLKGVAGNLGAMEVEAAARALDRGLKEGSPAVAGLLDQLEAVLAPLLAALQGLSGQENVTAVSSVPEAARMDSDRFADSCRRLLRLLARHDMAALEEFAELQVELNQLNPAAATNLAATLDNLDFKQALAILKKTISTLGIAGEEEQ